VNEYMAELRRLALHCDYGTHLDEVLRDQFVSGLQSENMFKRLLSVQIAVRMETAAKMGKTFQDQESVGIKTVANSCKHCGKTDHQIYQVSVALRRLHATAVASLATYQPSADLAQDSLVENQNSTPSTRRNLRSGLAQTCS